LANSNGQEKLIKHHFWIVLALAVVLLPVVAGSVVTGVADATDKKAKEIDNRKNALNISKPKGLNYVVSKINRRPISKRVSR